MLRAQKEDKVAALHESFQSASLVLVAHQVGLTVTESQDLRRQVRAAGAGFRVTKNRLAKIALKGTQFEHLDSMFSGPTAVVFSIDPVPTAKVLVDYAKKNEKVAIVGGGLFAQTLDKAAVEALTKLPSIEELRAKILGVLQTPASRIASVLQQPAGQVARLVGTPGTNLARVIQAYSQKSEAA